jgi:hypothetical protein
MMVIHNNKRAETLIFHGTHALSVVIDMSAKPFMFINIIQINIKN